MLFRCMDFQGNYSIPFTKLKDCQHEYKSGIYAGCFSDFNYRHGNSWVGIISYDNIRVDSEGMSLDDISCEQLVYSQWSKN